MDLKIIADYDTANIEVLSIEGGEADLAIRPDSKGRWFQWFNFLVAGEAGQALTLRITNAGASAYPDGWVGYKACVKEDGEDWPRVQDTTYADGVLTIRYTLRTEAAWFTYFAPYNQARHRTLIDMARRHGARISKLGWTVQGRPIECVTVGQGPLQIWVVGRQHSGETMASWWCEGAIGRLVGPPDPVVQRLLERATLHIVPIVNIDGVALGNLRGNAAGLDLNRQWHGPDPKTAPEVACILAAMDETGVHLSLDVHGDETLPHVFVDGSDADPASTPKQNAGVEAFRQALLAASPAFQTKVGYPPTYGGEEGKGMCTRAVAARFGAVGLTLEMPFKDSLETPDPVLGWSPAASRKLGLDCVTALEAVLDTL